MYIIGYMHIDLTILIISAARKYIDEEADIVTRSFVRTYVHM